jgi:hypothetical protein
VLTVVAGLVLPSLMYLAFVEIFWRLREYVSVFTLKSSGINGASASHHMPLAGQAFIQNNFTPWDITFTVIYKICWFIHLFCPYSLI